MLNDIPLPQQVEAIRRIAENAKARVRHAHPARRDDMLEEVHVLECAALTMQWIMSITGFLHLWLACLAKDGDK